MKSKSKPVRKEEKREFLRTDVAGFDKLMHEGIPAGSAAYLAFFAWNNSYWKCYKRKFRLQYIPAFYNNSFADCFCNLYTSSFMVFF